MAPIADRNIPKPNGLMAEYPKLTPKTMTEGRWPCGCQAARSCKLAVH